MAENSHAALDAQIARLRELGNLVKDSAPEVAKSVERELGAQIASGTGPSGKPWKPTQTGTTPLRGAAKALTVRAIGTVVLARLEGHVALHDQGRARGGVRRQILPSSGMPQPIERAIERVVDERFRQTMEGTVR